MTWPLSHFDPLNNHFSPSNSCISPNIRSDKEMGIGSHRDGQIARALRFGVKADGTALIPAMEFQNLSDDDLTAIISFLRTIPAVKYKVPENGMNLLGKGILAFIIRPEAPKVTPPKIVIPDTTAAYSKYVAENISSCRACHTERSMSTGEYIVLELAGGLVEPVVHGDPSKVLLSANLTPDKKTGALANWSFEQFKDRFQKGRLVPQTIIPWGQFKHLDDTELRAIWKYPHHVKPVQQENRPYVQAAK